MHSRPALFHLTPPLSKRDISKAESNASLELAEGDAAKAFQAEQLLYVLLLRVWYPSTLLSVLATISHSEVIFLRQLSRSGSIVARTHTLT